MRRTNRIVGMVNFPINSDQYENTKEGGMFVELWVVERKVFDCGVCCGYGNIVASYAGSLIGTDRQANHDNFSKLGDDEFAEFVKNGGEQRFPLEEELFPFIRQKENQPHPVTWTRNQYQSKILLACVTMGSTGWSGFGKDNEYWRCQYEDLNENGKLIYNALKKEYNNAELLLVTWLDT